VTCFSEILKHNYQSTWHHIIEYHNLNIFQVTKNIYILLKCVGLTGQVVGGIRIHFWCEDKDNNSHSLCQGLESIWAD